MEHEEEIRRYLDLPSSELGNDFSDCSEEDDGWDVDPVFRVTVESDNDEDIGREIEDPFQSSVENPESSVYTTLENVELSENEEDNIDMETAGPSTAKRPRKQPKKKTFKPKRKVSKNTKKKSSKYPHIWNKNAYLPEIFAFDNLMSGVVGLQNYPETCTELYIFQKLFTDEIIDFIVTETNKQYQYIVSHAPPSEQSRLKNWLPLSPKEFKMFLAVTMLMVHNKKIALEHYWSTDPLQSNSIPTYMSKNRYFNILRVLHFSDNTLPPLQGRLTKIKDLVDLFRKSFFRNFRPFRKLCIDESLLLFKGQLGFKQFIPSKRSRFGIKTYLLCDCETGYVLDSVLNAHAIFLCQSGKKPTLQQFHLEIVRQLIEENFEPRSQKKGGRPSHGQQPARLTDRHFPSYVPPTEKKAAPCRQCLVCKNTVRREQKRRETRYMCEPCGVALCATPCFAEFHQMKNY